MSVRLSRVGCGVYEYRTGAGELERYEARLVGATRWLPSCWMLTFPGQRTADEFADTLGELRAMIAHDLAVPA